METQLDVDPSNTSGDQKSRDHLIQSCWHDIDNQIIWFVDCDNDGVSTDFDVWKLDYSSSETAPTVTEIGSSTPDDAVYAYDILKIGANVYVIDYEDHAGGGYERIWDVDSAPITKIDEIAHPP